MMRNYKLIANTLCVTKSESELFVKVSETSSHDFSKLRIEVL